ncbi:MAG: nucleotidyltransferase domain-containing protein, partial [Candidatus Margulisbacteria bacterium]|nr:nucleotidyltransferase domain-containing protein [Candidatus Margulisiibacteriota bacterium]
FLNKEYSLLAEVEAIVRKTFGVETVLKEELSKVSNIVFAFLFGSYVKGGFRSGSDIDLFVIGEVDEDHIFKAVQKVESNVNREINYHLASPEEFQVKRRQTGFYDNILKDYSLLIGEESGFRKFIKQIA